MFFLRFTVWQRRILFICQYGSSFHNQLSGAAKLWRIVCYSASAHDERWASVCWVQVEERVVICLFVRVRVGGRVGMWVGAACMWVVQLWVERLSEMTVINSFTSGPVDYIINHIYWWCDWLTYLCVSVVPLKQADTSCTGMTNRAANICQLVMYLAT